MKELIVDPMTRESLPEVVAFVEEELHKAGCPVRTVRQVNVAVEEVFINIASYAYHPEPGNATIRCTLEDAPLRITIQFLDRGRPYNPLDREPPDTTLPLEEREVGGLGILLVRGSMSEVAYEYKDGVNVLTLRKYL